MGLSTFRMSPRVSARAAGPGTARRDEENRRRKDRPGCPSKRATRRNREGSRADRRRSRVRDIAGVMENREPFRRVASSAMPPRDAHRTHRQRRRAWAGQAHLNLTLRSTFVKPPRLEPVGHAPESAAAIAGPRRSTSEARYRFPKDNGPISERPSSFAVGFRGLRFLGLLGKAPSTWVSLARAAESPLRLPARQLRFDSKSTQIVRIRG